MKTVKFKIHTLWKKLKSRSIFSGMVNFKSFVCPFKCKNNVKHHSNKGWRAFLKSQLFRGKRESFLYNSIKLHLPECLHPLLGRLQPLFSSSLFTFNTQWLTMSVTSLGYGRIYRKEPKEWRSQSSAAPVGYLREWWLDIGTLLILRNAQKTTFPALSNSRHVPETLS